MRVHESDTWLAKMAHYASSCGHDCWYFKNLIFYNSRYLLFPWTQRKSSIYIFENLLCQSSCKITYKLLLLYNHFLAPNRRATEEPVSTIDFLSKESEQELKLCRWLQNVTSLELYPTPLRSPPNINVGVIVDTNSKLAFSLEI